MKIEFTDFDCDRFQVIPNINFFELSDSDARDKGYYYMLLFGWLFFGVRIYFRKHERRESFDCSFYRVVTVYNRYFKQYMYILAKGSLYGQHEFNIHDVTDYTLRLSDAFTKHEEILFSGNYKVLAWSDAADAIKVRDMINAIIRRESEDVWEEKDLPEPTS